MRVCISGYLHNKMKTDFSVSSSAFFLDVDGTLAEIQDHQDMAFIPERVIVLLQRLQRHGAGIALVSGRPLQEVRRMVSPLECAIAGTHGAECRNAAQRLLFRHEDSFFSSLFFRAQALTQRFPGITIENKGHTLAIHYRLVQEYAFSLYHELVEIVADYPDWSVQAGKCVYELKPSAIHKGNAVRLFMTTPDYAGRYPVFIGDDHCDEAGFAAVNALGGWSIKVGSAPTQAKQMLANVAAVHAWLHALAIMAQNPALSTPGRNPCHA